MPEKADGPRGAFRPARRGPPLARTLPITAEIRGYRPRTARGDATAAVTVAAVALPSAMAYAEVAGLSPVSGLYALLLPAVAYALLGSSRQLMIGPEGSIAALVGITVLANATAGSDDAAQVAGMLGLLVGGCFLLAWALRLGWIADYLSRPVLVGYMHGVAAVLAIGQLGKLLGLQIEADEPIAQLVEVAREIGAVSGPTVAVSAGALLVLLPLRFLAPRVPAPLLVVVAGIALSAAAGLSAHGVVVVGAIPSGLPDIRLPSRPFDEVAGLLPAALGIFLVTFADAILTARSYAGRHGQSVLVSQELLALGAANAASGISQGFPVGASGSRTAVADGMGVRTQFGGLAAAGVIVLILLLLTGPVADLPKAILAATIVSACIGLVDTTAWRELWRTDHVEVSIAAVTAAGVITVGVLEAIVFAVGLSVIDVVRRSARPHDAVLGWVEDLGRYADISLHRSAQISPGVVVYRLDDRLFFANAGYVTGRVLEAVRAAPSRTRWVVIDTAAMTHIDVAGLAALRELAGDLRREEIGLALARTKATMEKRLRDAGITDGPGGAALHPTVRRAVAACIGADPAGPATPTR